MTNHIEPASFAWGVAIGVTFGSWLRGTLDALFLNPRRRMGPLQGSYGLLDPPADVAAAINRQLDRDIAAELDRRRRRRGSNTPPLRCPPAHTIAECGGPCEQDFRLCDCGLLQKMNPQRAAVATTEARPVGLVERVAEAMQPGTFDWSAYEDEARAAIREVAAWVRSEDPMGTGPAWANLLGQEADRG